MEELNISTHLMFGHKVGKFDAYEVSQNVLYEAATLQASCPFGAGSVNVCSLWPAKQMLVFI